MSNCNHLLEVLAKGFVSSCQPVDNGPMDKPEIVAAMAMASVAGGAVGLRIEGVENLKTVRPHVSVPIVGIVKRNLIGSDIRITPFIEDIVALKEAGADIIAIDATNRPRPTSVADLVSKAKELNCLVMADCSTLEEGMNAKSLGVEIIGTTMSGYVSGLPPKEPDFEFVSSLANKGCFVMAEGRYNSPELAAKAIKAGAACVTVGSAITRIEHICRWFDTAVSLAHNANDEAVV